MNIGHKGSIKNNGDTKIKTKGNESKEIIVHDAKSNISVFRVERAIADDQRTRKPKWHT